MTKKTMDLSRDSKAPYGLRKDGKPKKPPGRKAGAPIKPKPALTGDLKTELKALMREVVNEEMPRRPPIPAPSADAKPAKLAPTKTAAEKQSEANLMIMADMDEHRSIFKIPNKDPERFYYWVHTHPIEQQDAIMSGFQFIVGEAECKKLGLDTRRMNSRSRIATLDTELAWIPMSVAVARGERDVRITKEKSKMASERFEDLASRVGKVEKQVITGAKDIISAGAEFDDAN